MSDKRAIVERINKKLAEEVSQAQQGLLIMLGVSAAFTLIFYLFSVIFLVIVCALAMIFFGAVAITSFRDLKRCKHYVVLIYGHGLTSLADIAERTGDSDKRVRSTIRAIISLGRLRDLSIDDITGMVVIAGDRAGG